MFYIFVDNMHTFITYINTYIHNKQVTKGKIECKILHVKLIKKCLIPYKIKFKNIVVLVVAARPEWLS